MYQGNWKDSKTREGLGKLTWPDESTYVGYWENDKAEGFGILKHADGDIFRGKHNGLGTFGSLGKYF